MKELARVESSEQRLPPYPGAHAMWAHQQEELDELERDAALGHTTWKVTRRLKQQLRRDRLSHLRSISLDAAYVKEVHAFLGKPPAFANLRCGVWYVQPDISSGHCYFKSTDGHVGHWGFSLSRINLNVALAAAKHGMALVVDATRSGKRFPDALTKTIPIWCCVVNKAVACRRAHLRNNSATNVSEDVGKNSNACGPSTEAHRGASSNPWEDQWDSSLRLPCWIPPSEVSQIEKLVEHAVSAFSSPALLPIVDRLVQTLPAPLVPFWLAAGEPLVAPPLDGKACWIVCLSASRVIDAETARETHSWTYIQGAGDDEENWARKLRAQQWWRCADRVLRIAEFFSHEEAEEELEAFQQGEPGMTATNAPFGCPSAPQHLSRTSSDGEKVEIECCDALCEAEAADGVAGHSAFPDLASRVVQLWDSGLLLGDKEAAAGMVDQPNMAFLNVGSPVGAESDSSMDIGGEEAVAASRCERAHADASELTTLSPISEPVEFDGDGTNCPWPHFSGAYCHLPIRDGKRAQPRRNHWQVNVLPEAIRFAHERLQKGERVLVFCDRGDDRAPTVVVGILLALFSADGKRLESLPPSGNRSLFSKADVRTRVAFLQADYPAARIQRRMQKELSNFFVAPQCGWLCLDFSTPVGKRKEQ